MRAYFDQLEPVTRDNFLGRFCEHVLSRTKPDEFEKDIYKTLEGAESLAYYRGLLNGNGVVNLVLPHHATELESGREPDRPVKFGGDGFGTIIENFLWYIRCSRFPGCTHKVISQQHRFFAASDLVLRAGFIFVCNAREYAHPGNSSYDVTHGDGKIYAGNGFHRFVAYGLWIKERGFRPLDLYYVEAQGGG